MRIVIAVFSGLLVTGVMVFGGDGQSAFFGSGMLDEHSIVRTLFNFAALLLVIPAAMLATRITPRRQPAF